MSARRHQEVSAHHQPLSEHGRDRGAGHAHLRERTDAVDQERIEHRARADRDQIDHERRPRVAGRAHDALAGQRHHRERRSDQADAQERGAGLERARIMLHEPVDRLRPQNPDHGADQAKHTRGDDAAVRGDSGAAAIARAQELAHVCAHADGEDVVERVDRPQHEDRGGDGRGRVHAQAAHPRRVDPLIRDAQRLRGEHGQREAQQLAGNGPGHPRRQRRRGG